MASCPLYSPYFNFIQENILEESRLRKACHHWKKKNICTEAMRRGIELEPAGAAQYSGNKVQICGLVVNPDAPHLGTSPDRRFQSDEGKTYEIKCLMQITYTNYQYIEKLSDNTYRLKRTHEYYFQIMGQLGITGMPWCDLFVKCDGDYYLERIHFEAEMWGKIKAKLDWYFFEHFLPIMCNGSL